MKHDLSVRTRSSAGSRLRIVLAGLLAAAAALSATPATYRSPPPSLRPS